MYTIAKKFRFSASHQADHLPPDDQCSQLHGHNYEVEVLLGAHVLNGDGMVRNYRDLRAFKAYLDDELDHRHLNDVLGGGANTTAERLAEHFYHVAHTRWPEVVAVRVSETPDTWACYSKGMWP